MVNSAWMPQSNVAESLWANLPALLSVLKNVPSIQSSIGARFHTRTLSRENGGVGPFHSVSRFIFLFIFFVWFNTPHNIPWFECFIANARDTMFRERTIVISLYHLIRWGSTRLIVTWRSSVFMAVKSRAPKWHTARCTCASKTGRSVESLYRSPSLLTDGESWRDAATFSRSFWRG